MKNLIALVIVMMCVIGLVGCNNDNQQVQENKTANTQTFSVVENSVSEIGREISKLSIEIADDDAIVLSKIINSGTWVEELTECKSDCVINLKGHWIYYNSKSGILNNYNFKEMSIYSSQEQEPNGKSLFLSEEDRTTVNSILEKYITLGFASN